jgi:uncharacterized membrane protein
LQTFFFSNGFSLGAGMAVASLASEKAQRFGSIDAVRGAAILFVFLSHFTAGYAWTPESQEAAGYLRTLSMIASPTFVTVSGMVAGFLAATNPEGFRELRIKLFDRGVFLLLIGHFLLSLTQLPSLARFPHAYRASFITDVIAIAIMIGPSLVASLGVRSRLLLAAAVFLVDWWFIARWHPSGGALTAKLYFVGLTSTRGELSAYPVFPVLPWFAVYLAGTALGTSVGTMYRKGHRKEAHYLVARIGAALFVAASAAHWLERMGRLADPSADSWEMNRLTIMSIYGKFPPGLVYLGFFGGAGLVMLATIFEVDRRGMFPLLFSELRKLGRSSLFIFTVQYALYRSVVPRLGLPYTPFWPLIFLASVLLLAALATAWDRHSANRFLTVGITSAWRRHSARVNSILNHPRPEPAVFRVRPAGAHRSVDA